MSRIAEHYLGDAPYPESPGFKERTTSRDAAVAAAGDATILRELVLAAIRYAGPQGLTADEAAIAVNRDRLSVRPRLSELVTQNRIIPTGQRRANASKRKAIAWRSKQ